jgi:membrane fusion protein, heavy metal efflux system
MRIASWAMILVLPTLCLDLQACRRSTPPHTTDAAPDGGAAGGDSVTLTPEVMRQAGIATEEIHTAPFAVTLSVPCRLSPTAETPEEVEARLNYQAAEARFVRADADLERLRKLVAQEVVAAKAVQAAEADFAEARVERQRALAALNNLGQDGSGQETFPTSDVWALAEIYEPQIARLKPGARAWIHVESFADEAFGAQVVSLARFLKPQTRTLTARISVHDPQHRLRPQEIGTAEIQISERQALSVPDSALLYEGTGRVLFVRRGAEFKKVRVRIGSEQTGRAEVVEGLADGDEVVTRGAQVLLGEMFKTRIEPGEHGEVNGDPGDR